MKKTMVMALLLAAVLGLSACVPQPQPAPTPTLTPAAEVTPAMEAAPAVTPAASETPVPAAAEYRRIDAAGAKARMDSGDPVIVLDVRTEAEYDSGHVPGSILLPNESIGNERPAELPDLDAEILVYCRSGNRSRQAAMKLVAMGYTNVHDFGGVNNWPFELVK